MWVCKRWWRRERRRKQQNRERNSMFICKWNNFGEMLPNNREFPRKISTTIYRIFIVTYFHPWRVFWTEKKKFCAGRSWKRGIREERHSMGENLLWFFQFSEKYLITFLPHPIHRMWISLYQGVLYHMQFYSPYTFCICLHNTELSRAHQRQSHFFFERQVSLGHLATADGGSYGLSWREKEKWEDLTKYYSLLSGHAHSINHKYRSEFWKPLCIL